MCLLFYLHATECCWAAWYTFNLYATTCHAGLRWTDRISRECVPIHGCCNFSHTPLTSPGMRTKAHFASLGVMLAARSTTSPTQPGTSSGSGSMPVKAESTLHQRMPFTSEVMTGHVRRGGNGMCPVRSVKLPCCVCVCIAKTFCHERGFQASKIEH